MLALTIVCTETHIAEKAAGRYLLSMTLHVFKTNTVWVTPTLQNLTASTRYILVYKHMEVQF